MDRSGGRVVGSSRRAATIALERVGGDEELLAPAAMKTKHLEDAFRR
jgi:hypothetical protein